MGARAGAAAVGNSMEAPQRVKTRASALLGMRSEATKTRVRRARAASGLLCSSHDAEAAEGPARRDAGRRRGLWVRTRRTTTPRQEEEVVPLVT